uniref:Uncharacterized protein n=1 Tax=Rhodnius prolixus TaxID=13249 RepID=T1HXF3_RHOPR
MRVSVLVCASVRHLNGVLYLIFLESLERKTGK